MTVISQSGLGDLLGGALQSGVSQGNKLLMDRMLNQQRPTYDLSGFSPILEQMGVNDNQRLLKNLSTTGMNPDEMIKLLGLLGKKEGISDKEKEKQKLEAEQEFTREKFSPVLSKLEDLKPYVGAKYIPGTKSYAGGSLNRESVQKRAEIGVLGKSLASILKKMLVSGNINQKEFDTYMEEIPTSEDSERVYQGKIDGFRSLLGIPERGSEVKGGNNNIVYAKNPKTGQVISSSDGGKTWQKVE